MINASRSSLDGFLHTQMYNLASLQSKFIISEFSNYIAMMRIIESVHMHALGYSESQSYFTTNIPYQNSDLIQVKSVWTNGAFYTPFAALSSEGNELEIKISALDPVLKIIYLNDYSNLYSGFRTDQILYNYPGTYIAGTTYSPIIREWFYKAEDDIYNTVVTEPYQDISSGYWIITVSEALLNNNTFAGVAAVDILLRDLTQKVSSTVVSDLGFNLLISPAGVILTLPSEWFASAGGSIIKIYDYAVTGISEAKWGIISNSSDGSVFQFVDGNGTSHELLKWSIIMPHTNQAYYLLIVTDTYNIEEQIRQIQNNFSQSNNAILWVVVGLGITFFAIMITLVYFISKNLARKLTRIEKLFSKLIRKALFPRASRSLNVDRVQMKCQGIESLITAVRDKLNSLEDIEDKHSKYVWEITRPSDKLFYTSWSEKSYPYRKNAESVMPWTKLLSNLNQVSPVIHPVKELR